MKALKWFDEHFEETILVLLLILICCIELIQVIVRNIPFIPALTWAEEFCRFCWIWSVFISLAYTIRKNSMLRVSVLLDALPGHLNKIINIFVYLVIIIVMGLLAYFSFQVVEGIRISGEKSSAMNWPMWIIYIIMVIGFILGTIRGIQQIIINIIHFNDKAISTKERTMIDAAEEVEAGRKAENITETIKIVEVKKNMEGGDL